MVPRSSAILTMAKDDDCNPIGVRPPMAVGRLVTGTPHVAAARSDSALRRPTGRSALMDMHPVHEHEQRWHFAPPGARNSQASSLLLTPALGWRGGSP